MRERERDREREREREREGGREGGREVRTRGNERNERERERTRDSGRSEKEATSREECEIGNERGGGGWEGREIKLNQPEGERERGNE